MGLQAHEVPEATQPPPSAQHNNGISSADSILSPYFSECNNGLNASGQDLFAILQPRPKPDLPDINSERPRLEKLCPKQPTQRTPKVRLVRDAARHAPPRRAPHSVQRLSHVLNGEQPR